MCVYTRFSTAMRSNTAPLCQHTEGAAGSGQHPEEDSRLNVLLNQMCVKFILYLYCLNEMIINDIILTTYISVDLMTTTFSAGKVRK